jgi:hypothetical protein
LVLALAFLSASFLARNSDLWFHLATGRLLAEGEFSFGADPFAYTTGDEYWASHAWLFDLGLYHLYGLVSGAGLVLFKALIVTALAWLLLRVRRPDCTAWLPAFCTTLAIVAMSPRLLLQPVCASYLLFGLTFWLLWRPHRAGSAIVDLGSQIEQQRATAPAPIGNRQSPMRNVLLLLLVFVLWVNVDEWFLLGPALVGLFWVGERLQGTKQTPGWLVPAGLAVCLLNPYTFHAFTLPTELSPVTWTSGLWQDARFQRLFASPWQPGYLYASGWLNASSLAYFVLTGLGLLSFLLRLRSPSDWRLAVWLPFAILAGWQARAVPFFAIVAAPITALNLQDAMSARHKVRPSTVGFVLRACYLVLLLALLFLTWPGWLAEYGREERHVAWDVQADPSLRQAAETLHRWRRQGLLRPGERVFAVAPEVAQYGAWFCPGEKHFLDHRLQLFPRAAQEYETVCRALLPDLVEDDSDGEPAKSWRQVLHDHDVGIVVFYDRDPRRRFAVLRLLAGDPQHWTLLNLAGHTVIAGWNEARPPGGFAPLAFDADRLALGAQDERARGALTAAPEEGPARLPSRRTFWSRLARPADPRSWESEAATAYLHFFEDNQTGERQKQVRAYVSAYAASLTGLPALSFAEPNVVFQLVLAGNLLARPRDFHGRDQLGPFFAPLVERSAALPLLAARAARRAVTANPEDSNAWLRLGQAYLLLSNTTCERSAEGLLPPLTRLRHVQIVTALGQALRLDPDLEQAHQELAGLYGRSNYLDQALVHRREVARLTRRDGRRAGETPEEWDDRLELLEKDLAKLEQLIEDRRQKYESASRQLRGERVVQAGLALRLGLARLALEEVLLPTPADLLGPDGMRLELELLLSLGRSEEVRAILSDEALQAKKHGLRYLDLPAPASPGGRPLYQLSYHWPAYDWLYLLQAAALGDYARARTAVHEIRSEQRIGQERLKQDLRAFPGRVAIVLPGLFAGPPPFLPAFTAQTVGRLIEERTLQQTGAQILRAQEADLYVLEGLLALEQGATGEARAAFVEAQQLGGQPPPVHFAGGPIAAHYLTKGVGNRK